MSESLQEAITTAITNLAIEPFEAGALSSKNIESAEMKKGHLKLSLALPFPAKSMWPAFDQALQDSLLKLEGVESVSIDFTTRIQAHEVQGNTTPLKGVKNIIAVASGKGGVGKSTTSVNLALALQQEGAHVGVLDADIYGPSIPTMLGVHNKPETKDGKSMEPISAYGLQLMSIGFLINPDDPMIWRGPIVTSTLTQLLNETNWQDLDYLIIDLPPGTGDVQLTLSQQIPVTGSIIVTTPQEVALIDARKGLRMFEKVNIPVLGVVENMGTHICSQCGHEEAIFGEHGGERLAEKHQVKFLGALPLNSKIRQQADEGKPTVIAEPAGDITLKYRHIAYSITSQIALKRRNFSSAFPNIVVENA
ncbi:MAG: iron-sulfur cluster carrier protein ApbC [Thiomicrospira sp.]|nr:MAG: iron-sulfur cluster carrier protein ApbC [Thiomicrospira sp.]